MNFVDLELLGGGLYWAFVISYTEYSVILCYTGSTLRSLNFPMCQNARQLKIHVIFISNNWAK